MLTRRRVLASLLTFTTCAAGGASAQEPDVAPVESDQELELLPTELLAPFDDPISQSRREHAEAVRRAREDPGAFRASGRIPLPPLFYTDPERSIYWVGLLYVDIADFEASTQSRMLAPFFLSMASKQDRTLITPLFGQREDEEGAAGYAGTYYWRRDRLADSDVVLPFFWSFRERDFEDGPDARSAGALAPFVFWRRRTSGEHFTFAPPLFWRWGDAQESTTIAALGYHLSRPGGTRFGVAPLYFAGRDESGEEFDACLPLLLFRSADAQRSTLVALNTIYRRQGQDYWLASLPLAFGAGDADSSWLTIPPALFFRASDAEGSSTFAINTYYESKGERDYTLASLPLVFAAREGEERHAVALPLFWDFESAARRDTVVAPFWMGGGPKDGTSRWDVIPPLLFGRASDEERDTSQTFVVNTYFDSRPDGYTLASFPLVFAGKKDQESWVVAPPLLFGRAADDEAQTSTTVVANTYYDSRPDGYTLASVPLLFAGREGEERWAVSPPLLSWDFESPGRRDSGVGPLWIGGERDGGKRRYDVIPPLLFGRASDEEADTSATFLINTYYASRPDGYSLTSFPFVFAGREGEDESMFILPALTYHEREGETTRTFVANTYIRLAPDSWSFAFAPLLFAGGDATGSRAVGPPLFWHFADEEGSTTVVAPFFHTRDARDGSWHAGFAPLWFSGRLADGSEYDIGPPLVWRFAGEDGERLAVLPLFDYSRDATRARVISPFMFHYSDADTVEHATSKTVVLGLYWDLKGPDLHGRVAFPLWWQLEDSRTGRGLSTLFPLYWRHEGEQVDTNVLLNAAWTSRRDGSGWSFHLFPFVDLASDKEGHFQWQVFGGLLGRERAGGRHRWRVGYVWLDDSEGA